MGLHLLLNHPIVSDFGWLVGVVVVRGGDQWRGMAGEMLGGDF